MSTKINVRSPFYKRYSASGLTAVELEIFIYSGTKTTDKGTRITRIVQKPLPGDEFVILELSSIIRDKLEVNATTPLNSNKDYIKWVQLESTITT